MLNGRPLLPAARYMPGPNSRSLANVERNTHVLRTLAAAPSRRLMPLIPTPASLRAGLLSACVVLAAGCTVAKPRTENVWVDG